MTNHQERTEGGNPTHPDLSHAFRAGDWIVDPELNSLRCGEEEERHVEPKVMKVLLALAGRENHVVPKDELMAAVWPETFVSDDVLTRCISVLRRVTRDDPQNPKFIQTVPKVGYRLVAPITELAPPARATAPALGIAQGIAQPLPAIPAAPRTDASSVLLPPVPAALTTTETIAPVLEQSPLAPPAAPLPEVLPPVAFSPTAKPTATRSFPTALLGVAVLVVLAIALGATFYLRRTSTGPETFRTLPFTSRDGEQLQPAFSPDGKTIAYAAVSEDGSSRHIYIKPLGTDTSTQITSGAGEDYSPVWSADGKQLAYLSRTSDQLGLYLVDAVANATAKRVFIPQEETQWAQGALTWSPDGRYLVFPDHAGSNPSSSLFQLDLQTLQAKVLTTPPNGWEGDLTPAYAPDGKSIAFTRASETAVRDIYRISLRNNDVQPITHDPSNVDSIAWNPDGKSIVFSTNRGGKFALWRTTLKTGRIERLPVGTEDAFQPATSADGRMLAYTQGAAVWQILQITPVSSQAILSSTQNDSAPTLATDGSRIAFQSQRSGSQEIWIAKADGTDLQQLTHRNGPLTGSPSWSHDGKSVLFDSRVAGHSHIFLIAAQGGQPQQLTFGDTNDIVPRWSHDDRAVYFRSNRGGRWQLWRMSYESGHLGNPQQVTTGDGIAPQESADGKTLYYTRGGEDGLWSTPTSGGPEKQLLDQPLAGLWGYWQLTPGGIFYLHHDKDATTIRILNPQTGQSRVFAKAPLTTPGFAGLTVSPDGKTVLLTDATRAGRHITLVEKSE